MTTKEKLTIAVKAIDCALKELDGVSDLLNDHGLEYSYTDISKAVYMLDKCYQYAKEERGPINCPDCGGSGEVINDLKVHSAIIDIPYKSCTNCCGKGEIEE